MTYPGNSSVSGPGREGRGEFHGPSSELPAWLIGNQPQIIAEQQVMIARLTKERNAVQKSARERYRQTMAVRQHASAIADKYDNVVKDNRAKEKQITDLKKELEMKDVELTKANETNKHLAADNAQKTKKLSVVYDLLAGIERLKLAQELKGVLSQGHNVGEGNAESAPNADAGASVLHAKRLSDATDDNTLPARIPTVQFTFASTPLPEASAADDWRPKKRSRQKKRRRRDGGDGVGGGGDSSRGDGGEAPGVGVRVGVEVEVQSENQRMEDVCIG